MTMRRCLGVPCESPTGLSQLQPFYAPFPSMLNLIRFPTSSTPRSAVSASVSKAGHSPTTFPPFSGDVSTSNLHGNYMMTNPLLAAPDGRCQANPIDAGRSMNNGAVKGTDPLLSDFLIDQVQLHRAPTGMADRIAAASERFASQQRRQKQGQHVTQQRLHQTQSRSPQGLPHDPDSCRFWEARLLSRACLSLAFHISSHFHVPSGPLDPLASLLSSSAGPAASATSVSLAPPFKLLSLSPPMQPGAFGDTSTPAQHGDLHGMYDNLPAVYALKAVAVALVDPALWRTPYPGASPLQPSYPAKSVPSNPTNGNPVGNSRHLDPPSPFLICQSVLAPESGPQSLHAEAPPAMKALIHVVAAGLVQLSHACGHPGCYNLAGPTAAVAAVTAGVDAPAVASLSGVPFTGRQLTRLYDMANVMEAVDTAALAAVPASTAAVLLLLLAAAQPPRHPALRTWEGKATRMPRPGAVSAASGAGGGGGCITSSVAAALLARYLRIGSRAHNPMDTVRVMWSLLRLQLPDAGPLLQPVELDLEGSSSNSSGSSSSSSTQKDQEAGDGLNSATLTFTPPPSVAGPDPMAQLARILSRQLRHQNRGRALSILRAARPGELYGTWQLAVQASVLLRDRAMARERSEAAMVELNSALALLEATLTGSGSTLQSGSKSQSGSVSEAGSGPVVGPPVDIHAAQKALRSRERKKGGMSSTSSSSSSSSSAEVIGRGGQSVIAVAAAVHEPWTSTVNALQAFLELCKEASFATATAGREPAAAVASTPPVNVNDAPTNGSDVCGCSGPVPAFDAVPWSDAEWRSVLGDMEQRAALLLSTWPELGRLVEQQPQHPSPSLEAAGARPREVAAERDNSERTRVSEPMEAWTPPTSASTTLSTAASVAGAMDSTVPRRRLRIHLQSYSSLHFRTLELLYRAVKAQAPDATLLAPLSTTEVVDADVDCTTTTTVTGATVIADGSTTSTATIGGVGGGAAALSGMAAGSQRISNALALPYNAAVDMIFTDVKGRRVGLCLAHLGTSRRAPGELAVLNHALTGWPEAEVAAAQQGIRAARSAARAAAVAAAMHKQARTVRTAAATAVAATAFAMTGAAAAADQSGGNVEDAGVPSSVNMNTTEPAAAAAVLYAGVANEADDAVAVTVREAATGISAGTYTQLSPVERTVISRPEDNTVRGSEERVLKDDDDFLDGEERALAAATAAALEADAAAVAAAPEVVAAAAAEAAASAASQITVDIDSVVHICVRQMQNLDLDDVVALELDHDWFHLRESYHDQVLKQNKWDPDVRQAISMAMSYMELPWEAQLDMVWHALSAAGVRLPIRLFP